MKTKFEILLLTLQFKASVAQCAYVNVIASCSARAAVDVGDCGAVRRVARLLLARLGGGGGGLLVVEQPLQLEVLAALHAQGQLRLLGGKYSHSKYT